VGALRRLRRRVRPHDLRELARSAGRTRARARARATERRSALSPRSSARPTDFLTGRHSPRHPRRR
jgi:hypothetical protein